MENFMLRRKGNIKHKRKICKEKEGRNRQKSNKTRESASQFVFFFYEKSVFNTI